MADQLRTFVTRVVATEKVTPLIRQITFGGGDLVDFEPISPDQFLYVLLPPPERTELTVDSSFDWETWNDIPEEDRPAGAYYTVRRWRPENAELDMWFVLHGDEGNAAKWAANAVTGLPAALWGPRTTFGPAASANSYLLVADETGLPAIAAILEALPKNSTIKAVIEVANRAETVPLANSDIFDPIWLFRDDAEAGTTTGLIDTVRRLDLIECTYAWGGAESRAITSVRKYLRHELGWPRQHVSMTGYWRHSKHTDEPGDD